MYTLPESFKSQNKQILTSQVEWRADLFKISSYIIPGVKLTSFEWQDLYPILGFLGGSAWA